MKEIKCCVCGATPDESEDIYDMSGFYPIEDNPVYRHRHPDQCIDYLKQSKKNILKDLGKRAYDGCVKRGFTDSLENDDKALLLIHSEISEAVEALRHENPPSNHIPEFSGVEEELADIVIRVCNYAYAKNFRLSEAIVAKMDFNDTREFQHGGKKF